MKRVLVIGRQNVGEKNDAIQLAKAIARHATIEVVGAYFEDIVLSIHKDNVDAYIHNGGLVESLKAYETVIMINWSHNRLYTDFAHSLAYMLNRHGVMVWNRELIEARSSTKISQLVRLSYQSIPVPETIFTLRLSLAEEYVSQLGVPFVAKDPLASRGRHNYLCNKWSDVSNKDSSTVFILQEFIPNNQSDLRMFIAGGKPVLAILRSGQGNTHLNNISQGASAQLVEVADLPQKLVNDTITVATHFKRDLCGIDFMQNINTKEYVFLEINATPQIVNGSYVDEKALAIATALEEE